MSSLPYRSVSDEIENINLSLSLNFPNRTFCKHVTSPLTHVFNTEELSILSKCDFPMTLSVDHKLHHGATPIGEKNRKLDTKLKY